MADLATLQTRKLEAELALHKLLTGSLSETVEHGVSGDAMRLTYTRVNVDQLQRYIADLATQIAAAGGAGLKRRPFVVEL